MDILIVASYTIAIYISWKAWHVLPDQLSIFHEQFRKSGSSTVYDASGRDTGITIDSSACRHENHATFLLYPPMIVSKAVLEIDGAKLHLRAVTRWPSNRSFYELDSRN